jgi:hypothetical protein
MPGAAHDLDGADDERFARFADALSSSIEARELPPVLVAIEEMTRDG